MKLSHQQIDALSAKISKELREEQLDFNDTIRKEAYRKFYKTDLGKALQKLQDSELKNLIYVSSGGSHQYLDKYLGLELKPITYSTGEIRNELIIGTIECENLDELINKIKNKYK